MNHHLDQEVVVGFISEAKGYLPEIMLGLESFAADATQLHSIKEAFRYAHIIKGAASMLGFMHISEVAYQLEVTLEMLCEEHLPLSQELLEDMCKHVGDLADMLSVALPETAADSPMLAHNDVLSPLELSAPDLSATSFPDSEQLLPSLLLPPAAVTEPAEPTALTPLRADDLSLPEFSCTPPALEEKEQIVMLPVSAAEEEILPEARTLWYAHVSSEMEAEEPLLALLDETSFAVSLPETTEMTTIGEADLTDIAQDLQEEFGAYSSLPQPEFALPEELLTGLPELQFNPFEPAKEMLSQEESIEENDAALLRPSEPALPEVREHMLPNLWEDQDAHSFDQQANPLAEDLLTPAIARPEATIANVLQGETFLVEYPEEALALPAPPLPEEAPDFQTPALPTLMLDEALPAMLLELDMPTDFEQHTAFAAFDAAIIMPEPAISSSPEIPSSLQLSSSAISDDMAEELMETFLLEAEEHLQNLQTSLRVLYKNPNSRDLLQEVRRSSHSLKGTAAMVGLDNIMQLAHRMEDVLDLIYNGVMPLTQERTLLLMQATDALEDMSNGQSNAGEVQHLYEEFARVLTAVTASPKAMQEAVETSSAAWEAEVATGRSDESASVPVFAETAELRLEPAAELLLTQPTDKEHTAIANVLESAEELTAPSVLLSEQMDELPRVMLDEVLVEATNDTAPTLLPETFVASALPVPMALVAPAVAPTIHEPEVLPSTQTGAMTQASSQFVRVPIERLDDIVKLISEMIITRTTFEQRLADFGRQVKELQMTGTRLRRASSNLESKYEVSTLGGGRSSFMPNNVPPGLSASGVVAAQGLVNSLVTHNTHGFDDLEFDRYTEFHLVSRELVESSTDIQTLGHELNHLNSDFLSYLNRQGRIYSDLQDRLMRLRMVPLASLAPRLHRTVRTVSVQQHKEVELILEGDATAIDTNTLQEMTDPLLHLLRNAVDHGIEAPDVRAAQGKAPGGKITLRAFYEGSQVVIQLRDDGQGLDLNQIRNRALQHALITSTEAEAMSAQDLWALIFTPGFSTAATVSEISGRGVGMDVVHTTVQKLKGTITIDSQPQVGTTFTIRLPMTLAVTRSLMVKANGQTFAIPLDVVAQIMRLEMSKVERIGKEPVIRLGGKVYPLLMLSRLLNLRQPSDEVSQRPPALLLNVEGKEVVVIVDQLMGGREIVIKTLGTHLRKIHGVMGATLMGDGEVVLILNLAELLRSTVRRLPRRTPLGNAEVMDETSAAKMIAPGASLPVQPLNKTLTIMIVDDSPSVRRVSSNMIKNTGWLPTLAKDGLEALEQLQASELPPDLILLDIEMPRMDGFQFLASVRSLPAYRNLPVVIVSSRSSEKHRQKAFDLGATEYLVKPYQEDNVITLIRRLVQESQQ